MVSQGQGYIKNIKNSEFVAKRAVEAKKKKKKKKKSATTHSKSYGDTVC